MTRRATTRLVRTIPADRSASSRARAACAAFGLVAEPGTARPEAPIPADDAILRDAMRQPVVLITGPSGSGKSRSLRRLEAITPRRIIDSDPASIREDRCVFDAVGASRGRTTRALASSGLAEPALWARRASVLSVGERDRLAIARAMAAARPGDVVRCDEFASNLDRASASALARTASRWARRAGVTLVVAAPHEDMPAMLGADAVLEASGGRLRDATATLGARTHVDKLTIEPGTLEDYRALSRYHYLGGKPATVVRILRAVRRTPYETLLAGVLVVSVPTFNGVWRRQAWPGRYAGADKQFAARRINRELRCISRVIVEPRSRGLGVASSLVRAYLADPLTPATEAVAAMGGVSPFFKAAGMTEYRLPRPPHDARLLDALQHACVPVALLAEPETLRSAFIQRELTRWAKHARVRIDEPDPLPHIARHALCRLSSAPRAYAHTRGGNDEGRAGED